MTVQENGDLLIQVTTWAGLTLHVFIQYILAQLISSMNGDKIYFYI